MRVVRLASTGLAVPFLAVFALPSAAQTGAKAKTPAALVANPGDLAKAGSPLSPRALISRPLPLKGVRAWTLETRRHRWIVTHLAVRPDGQKVATGGYDGIVRIWDAESGAFERALVGHEGYSYGLAWSPDGNYLASAGVYSTRIWDGRTGMPVRVLKDSKYGVVHVAWSPDGTRLLTGGGGSGQLAVWDVATGKQLAATEYGNPILGVAYSPTGTYVAAAASRAGTYIADPVTLKTVHTFKDALDTDNAVAFSPDGSRLAVGSAKMTAIYDVAAGSMTQKLSIGGAVLIWTPRAGLLVLAPEHTITPHSPGDLVPGKALPGTARTISLTASGETLFGLVGEQVARWDLEKGTSGGTFPVGELLSVNGGSATAVLVPGTPPALWDPQTGKRIGGLDEHRGALGAVAWAPGGKMVAVAAADRKIRLYEPATARPIRTLTAPAAVVALTLTSDGKLAAATADRKVVLWSAKSDQPTHTLADFANPVRALSWTRDGRLLATGNGKEIRVWSADSGKLVKGLEHPRDIHSVAWMPDGTRLVIGSSEEMALAYYQASTWKLQPMDRGTAALNVVASVWSPDGSTLLGHRNSGVQLWQIKAGRMGVACPSPISVSTLGFWPDGKTVVGGCADRAVRLWDASTGRLRTTVVFDRDRMLALSADGHHRIPEGADEDIVAVVQTDKVQDTLPIKEFISRHGFRNVAGNVK